METNVGFGNDFENYKNQNAHLFNESDDEQQAKAGGPITDADDELMKDEIKEYEN